LAYICLILLLVISLFFEEMQFLLLLQSDLFARGGAQFPVMLTALVHVLVCFWPIPLE
jgi:hypothetical protein